MFSRTAAHSGRHYAAPERSGRDPACDGSIHAGARLGAPARCPILGTSGGDEPRRLWRDKERTEEARELLAPVYGQFTEGFETTDLKAAKPLVD